ncbi:MAG: AtpZ/AtpI family protein [Lachnospiraceae bacterium]|nr:AtpZ/AtpI family protein [Lachnospiraceae bacterium]
MKNLSEIMKHVCMLGQLGLSIIIPIIICVLLCWFLTDKAGVGEWVFIPGLILGIGASFMSGYKFYLAETKKSREEDKKKTVSFNKHM